MSNLTLIVWGYHGCIQVVRAVCADPLREWLVICMEQFEPHDVFLINVYEHSQPIILLYRLRRFKVSIFSYFYVTWLETLSVRLRVVFQEDSEFLPWVAENSYHGIFLIDHSHLSVSCFSFGQHLKLQKNKNNGNGRLRTKPQISHQLLGEAKKSSLKITIRLHKTIY